MLRQGCCLVPFRLGTYSSGALYTRPSWKTTCSFNCPKGSSPSANWGSRFRYGLLMLYSNHTDCFPICFLDQFKTLDNTSEDNMGQLCDYLQDSLSLTRISLSWAFFQEGSAKDPHPVWNEGSGGSVSCTHTGCPRTLLSTVQNVLKLLTLGEMFKSWLFHWVLALISFFCSYWEKRIFAVC